MPTIRLTDTAIRKAIQEARNSSTRVELIDATAAGLRLRIARDGSSAWSLKMRDATGAGRRFALGDYPTLGIAEARERAAVTRHRVRHEGADPVAEKRAAREMATQPNSEVTTLGRVVAEYGRARKAGDERWPEYRQRIEIVFRSLLDHPAAGITLADLQRTADGYGSPGSASSAVRYIRPVLKWATKSGYVSNETVLIEEPRRAQPRERVLSPEELRAIVPVLMRAATNHGRRKRDGSNHRTAMLWMLMTATRRNETCRATWTEFNLESDPPTWTIPPDHIKDTKRGRRRRSRPPHVIALPRQAVAMIRAIRPDTPDPSALVFGNERGGLLSGWDRATKRIFKITGTSGWTRHDLRRTAATEMGELGVSPHVIEAVLNHSDIHSRLASTYNRSRYDPEQAEALQLWADRLEQVLNEQKE